MHVWKLQLCFFITQEEKGAKGGIGKHWQKPLNTLICSHLILSFFLFFKNYFYRRSASEASQLTPFTATQNEKRESSLATAVHVEELWSSHLSSSPLCGRETKPEGDASLSTTASDCWLVHKHTIVHLLNVFTKAKCSWKQKCWQVWGAVARSALADRPETCCLLSSSLHSELQ